MLLGLDSCENEISYWVQFPTLRSGENICNCGLVEQFRDFDATTALQPSG